MLKSLRRHIILFLCTGNACRSQMAEGWARMLKGDVIERTEIEDRRSGQGRTV